MLIVIISVDQSIPLPIDNPQTSVYFVPRANLSNNIQDFEREYILRYADKTATDVSYESILYDIEDYPSYILLTFSQGGYAIMMRIDAHISEYTNQGTNPYINI